jgi:hypothetical protein
MANLELGAKTVFEYYEKLALNAENVAEAPENEVIYNIVSIQHSLACPTSVNCFFSQKVGIMDLPGLVQLSGE